MLPNFIVIGAQKSGTTSLWAYLRQHPEVFLPAMKEPNYFVEELAWTNGLSWYEDLFSLSGGAKAVGECSTLYTMFPTYAGVPSRIAALLPEARLIYLMRNPIDRMISLYGLHLMAGWETRSLSEALLLDTRYADSSRYAMQIQQYLRYFPESQILRLKSEDLRDDRAATLRTILQFIGVEPGWEPPDIHVDYNTRDDQRVPRDWTRRSGDLLIRTGLASLVPDVITRHNRSKLATRPIREQERILDKEVRERLGDVLRNDLERLRAWMGPSFDAWGLLE
jgi:hypothetical protein